MRKVYKIDGQGFYVEDVILEDDQEIPLDCIEEDPPEGVHHKHKWNGTAWVEGLTQAEIDAINNVPVPKSKLEILQETVDQLVLDSLMGGS